MCECRLGNVQVVLAAHRKNHPAARQLRGITLEGEKRLAAGAALAELDTVDAVITDHAAPEGVVQIEYQAFARQPGSGRRDPRQMFAI